MVGKKEGISPTLNLGELNLPPDYEGLSRDGKKQARLAGLRKQGPDPDDFVRAWVLFRTYYLRQLPEGVFYKEWADSAPFHYDIVRDMAKYRLNAWACPRGSAKSVILGTEVPLLLLLTRPNFEILLILAKESMIQRRVGKLMLQMETNPFILEDFGLMKPPRGSRIWNHSILQLENGAALVGMPVEGKLLGERPDLILNDDPEHDKAMSQDPNPVYLREAFERLLYGVLMPMLRRGSRIGWIGTLLDARSFLYKFQHGNEPYVTKLWNRRNLAILTPEGKSLWPARWSLRDIKDLEESMPDEYFQTHFMNRPGTGRGGILKIHPQFCLYSVEPEVNWVDSEEEPLHCASELVTHRALRIGDQDGMGDDEISYEMEEVRRPFGEVVRTMRKTITVDFGFSMKSSADYSVIHVLGYENGDLFTDTLWSLDLWMGHVKISKLIPLIWYYAKKWRVEVIACEAVAHQGQILEPIQEFVEKQRECEWGWSPLVVPIKYPVGIQKAGRIAALSWKFDRFRIKLPSQRRHTFPYRELYKEIELFDETMRGLAHDDAIDSLAMYQFIGSGKPRTGPKEPGEEKVNIFQKIKEGELFDSMGIPYLAGVDPSCYPVEDLRKLMLERTERRNREEGSVEWVTA